jgi:isoquinoline 1-oxidoreductase beta subunit
VASEQGDVVASLASGDIIESEYLTPYMDHFNMEPLNGTALVEDDRVEMWMPTQHTQQVLYLAADETGVPPENVFVNQTWVGTGLGRRVFGDDGRMVVAIARQMKGTPIKVIWTREESMRQGRYRQAIAGKLSGKLNAEGMIETLKISTAGAGAGPNGLVASPYKLSIPNYLVQTQNVNTNLYTGPWRGPNWNSNCFMLESFINECAEKAQIDAIEYRKTLLANFEDKSWIKLLDVVAEKSGWGKELDRGLAQGVAIGNWGMATSEAKGPVPATGTTVAAVVTAEVSRRGDIYIPRVDIAIDAGNYINQNAITLMVEGGVNLTLGAALHEEINIDKGKVVEGNLDTYRVFRQNDPALPLEIHVHYEGMSGGERFSEVGEPPMGPPPPALSHAIFKLTGKWLRSFPFDKLELT